MPRDDRDKSGRKTALITGASSGIGEAFAKVFAENGFDLVSTARRRERLESLAEAIRKEQDVEVRVCPLDLADASAPQELAAWLATQKIDADALVNSAGYALAEPFSQARWAAHEEMLRVMAIAPVELCHPLLPGMKERGRGWIINVSSLATFVPDMPGSLYGPIKDFLLRASGAIAQEVEPSGIHVTALCPGFTDSEFHDVVGNRAEMNRLPGFIWMSSQEVAREGFAAVMAGRHVYINGRVNRAIAALFHWIPKRLIQSAIELRRRRQGRA